MLAVLATGLAAILEVRVDGLDAEKRTRAEAQDALEALVSDEKIPQRMTDGAIASDAIALRTFAGSSFEAVPLEIWTTGCSVSVHERECNIDSPRCDRFAGRKTHRTAFIGFTKTSMSLDPDLNAYVTSSPCEVEGYGKQIVIPRYDVDEDILGICEGLEHEHALDIEHVYYMGDYGGGRPNVMVVKMCTGGILWGWASAKLHMAGYLGWQVRDKHDMY